MRVLIVDDEANSVEPLVNELKQREFFPEVCQFEDVEVRLKEFRPGVIVLDLLKGTSNVVGDVTYKQIWEVRFCPIIIYSAQPNQIDSDDEHPFIAKVQKGQGSESEAADTLADFAGKVRALERVSDQLDKELHGVLREVAPKLPTLDGNLLARVVMRRLAASFDIELSGAASLYAWEQYIYPPIHAHFVIGDILREVEGAWDSPEAHRIILTPTCDLVDANGRSPKVESVLVAMCSPSTQLKEKKNKLKRLLSSGFDSRLLALIVPGFDKVLPHMLAELRSLELIELDLIALDSDHCDGHRFCRVASIDSPFRELVTWCYLHVTGRPGIPDRNVNAWFEEIEKERNKD